MKIILLSLLSTVALAADANPALLDLTGIQPQPAPAALELASYQAWAAPLLAGADAVSAFTPNVFAWYEREKDAPLPAEVAQDPDRIVVNVQGPLAETQALEASGDITEGNTVGAEVYAEQTGTLDQALATMLYRWGRPTGAAEGQTFAPGGLFQRRTDYFAANAEWGSGAYGSLSLRRDGGIAKDLADRYLVLVRGDGTAGYDVLMQYVKPAGATATEKCFAIATLRSAGEGKVAYKISTRYQGQVYKVLGNLSIGRSQIGFNAGKVRALQVESNAMLKELQDTGTIHDHVTDIGYGH